MLDANFKLDDLLKLELHKFADEVGEIVDCAQKEEKMEQGLAKLKVTYVSWITNATDTCMVTEQTEPVSCRGAPSFAAQSCISEVPALLQFMCKLTAPVHV